VKAKCEVCKRTVDYAIKDWSWVRFRGDSMEKLVCPQCRLRAEEAPGNVVSPAKL
jgi:uncharacterized protein YlaI